MLPPIYNQTAEQQSHLGTIIVNQTDKPSPLLCTSFMALAATGSIRVGCSTLVACPLRPGHEVGRARQPVQLVLPSVTPGTPRNGVARMYDRQPVSRKVQYCTPRRLRGVCGTSLPA